MAELHEDDFFHIYSQESLYKDWERLSKTESPERHSSEDEEEDEGILPDLEHEEWPDLHGDVSSEGRWSPELGYYADDDVTTSSSESSTQSSGDSSSDASPWSILGQSPQSLWIDTYNDNAMRVKTKTRSGTARRKSRVVAYVIKQLKKNGIDGCSIKPGDFTIKKRRVLFNACFPVCLQSLALTDAAQMIYEPDIEEMRGQLIFLGRKRMLAVVHADGRLVVDAKDASLKDACDLMVEIYMLMLDFADFQN